MLLILPLSLDIVLQVYHCTSQITAAEASSLNTVPATTITATVAPAASIGCYTMRGRTNAFTLTPTDTSATAQL